MTSCPTGIAHTYMAAEALEAAAQRAGVEIEVETQGSAGSKPLPQATIDAADAVVFATDVGVRDKHRFAGKPVVATGVKRPIDDGDAVIAEALRAAANPSAARVEGAASAGDPTATAGESWGGRARRVLMTGVSYMIPFVAAGGLLIALAFLLGGYEIALGSTLDGASVNTAQHIVLNHSLFSLPDPADYQIAGAELTRSPLLTYLGALLMVLGGAAFGFLVPALSGYIAYAIADRPGIAPGFVMGAISVLIGAGFLGGIVGGVLAGVVALWVARWKVPVWSRGLMPVAGDPAGRDPAHRGRDARRPVGAPQLPHGGDERRARRHERWLGHPARRAARHDDGLRHGRSAEQGRLQLRHGRAGDRRRRDRRAAAEDHGRRDARRHGAAARTGAWRPPLRPRLFSSAERENGKAAWALGASFITEGAIPFAAADPLRVIPAIVLGSGITGGLAQAFDVSLRAPHGGIFVLFAVDGVLGFVIALAAGVLAAAAAVIALKSVGRAAPVEAEPEPVAV